ncbi:MAG: hypothetical protein OET44_08465 [Gammaproteobacteria bacterium]|nr:hypothetical protein [Gammaproteobacteria bacterium]
MGATETEAIRRNVLEKLQKAALLLAPLERFSLIAVLALCTVFAMSVFEISIFAGDTYLIPSLVGVLWLLSLYSFIVCFRSLPENDDAQGRLLARIRFKLLRAVYWAIALLLFGVSAGVLLLSVRFFNILSA